MKCTKTWLQRLCHRKVLSRFEKIAHIKASLASAENKDSATPKERSIEFAAFDAKSCSLNLQGVQIKKRFKEHSADVNCNSPRQDRDENICDTNPFPVKVLKIKRNK